VSSLFIKYLQIIFVVLYNKDMKRCDVCEGMKKVQALGGMSKKCSICDGQGVVSDVVSVLKKDKHKDKKDYKEVLIA